MSFVVSKKIDLSNPAKIGAELLKDPKGDLPLDVWESYCRAPFAHLGLYPLPVLSWRIDPSDPKNGVLDPQHAVDEALSEAMGTVLLLKSARASEALESAKRTVNILCRGSSLNQPKRGQPASMRPTAVRAYIIRKFHPHSKKPGEPALSWSQLADLLFKENGKCRRCGVARHQSKHRCVKGLMTAERNLRSAMKHDGIPV